MHVVRVGLRGPPALSLRVRGNVGQFLAALGQDGPVPPADAPAFVGMQGRAFQEVRDGGRFS